MLRFTRQMVIEGVQQIPQMGDIHKVERILLTLCAQAGQGLWKR